MRAAPQSRDTLSTALAPWRLEGAPPPRHGESLDGYVARVAASQFMPRSLDITSLAGATFGHRPQLSRCRHDGIAIVADCLGIEADDLCEMGAVDAAYPSRVRFLGTSVDRRHVTVVTRRFAPAAMALDDPVHRAMWTLVPFPFDVETWQLLTDRCSSCETTQRWHHTPGIDLCDRCGEPLARAETTSVAEDLRERLSLAAGLVDPDPERRQRSRDRLGAPLQGLAGGEALDLLCAVATVVDPSIRIPNDHHAISRRADPKAVIGAIAEAWAALSEWPEGFARLAADRLSRRPGRHGDGNSGNTLHLLFGLDGTRFGPKVNAALRDLVEYLRDGTSRGYPIKRAAAIVPGATATGLAEARRRGEIPTVFHLNGERPVPLLDRASIDKMAMPSITAVSVAEQLGITAGAVPGLVRLGLLEPCTLALGRSDRERVTILSLDALLRRLADVARPDVSDPLPIRSAMAVVAGRRKPWAAAIAAMLDGRLPFSNTGSKSAVVLNTVISTEDLALIETLESDAFVDQRPATVSLKEASEILNVHVSKGTHLLSAQGAAHRGQLQFQLADIERLGSSLMSSAELCVRLGIPKITARRLMQRHGIGRLSEGGYDRASVIAALPALASIGGIAAVSDGATAPSN